MQYYVVDAFSDKLFGGNPAGVCLLQEPVSDMLMQSIAAENNLAETAFLLPEHGGYNLRWFTPEQEFDLCGHATLASAFVLFTQQGYPGDTVCFSTVSGALTVRRAGGELEMDFPARMPKPAEVLPIMEEAVGAEVLEAHLSRDMMLVLENEQVVRKAQPDLGLVAQIPGCVNLILTAKGDSADFVSRYFTPGISIPEDPVTGSAHCTLAPYWAKRLGKTVLDARQLSRRGGRLRCKVEGQRVKLYGSAQLYLSGTLHI